ncbi:protein of unknown function [Xenorhabdus poinarii G6]|uniref:Uncharacterized protein n=1 Tax=Xenorhabdus poinarii G6 TaxID=1354304 RepID=A0A068R668_9GAMM|nr:protein of unknown function [Xenorhabdus poinarii G6]
MTARLSDVRFVDIGGEEDGIGVEIDDGLESNPPLFFLLSIVTIGAGRFGVLLQPTSTAAITVLAIIHFIFFTVFFKFIPYSPIKANISVNDDL